MVQVEQIVTVEENLFLTPGVRKISFRLKQPMSFKPGQFITLWLPYGDTILRRSYSLANLEKNTVKVIEIAVSAVPEGRATKILFALHPGDEVKLTGPFGRLVLPVEQKGRYILVGTGTGIAPYRTMLMELEELIQKNEQLSVLLLFGVRERQEACYLQDFIDFADRHKRFTYKLCLSRQDADSADEYAGYVQGALAEETLNPDQDLVYLCGNPAMIDETVKMLLAIHFPQRSIKREKYISSN
jgi:NAD(P)H-flavin reductase